MSARTKTHQIDDRCYPANRQSLPGFRYPTERLLRARGPSGDKRWQVEYRPYPGGRGVAIKRVTLGATNVLTPDQARDQAKEMLAAVGKGEDPARDKIGKAPGE